jgi:hypothetical protein
MERAMRWPDPVMALEHASEDRSLPLATRRALRRASPDGVRLAALLVGKLRFERLVRGSPDAEAWFERDPASFAEAFRRYHQEVPPTAFFPRAEGRLFGAWLAAQPDPALGPRG